MRRARVLALLLSASAVAVVPAQAQTPPPTTSFEDNGGADWTPHEEELAFLETIAEMSDRVEIEVILDETTQGRPMHLVKIGHPVPHTVQAAQDMPVELHMCSQHGNEPAGREACLITIRNLAFTDDPGRIALLGKQATLFIPTANPDGRANNSRTSGAGSDLNRQHLQVDQPEVRAIGRVVRDWKPVMNMDHHEYGPTQPGVYDDDILILWPRNLNVHGPLQRMAASFVQDDLVPCLASGQYSSDEYGQASVSTPAGDLDAHQTAGDWDDGISRNAAGLRHSLGILAESAVSVSPTRPAEVIAAATTGGLTGDNPATMSRRVYSQVDLISCTLDWMDANGPAGYAMTRQSMLSKALEGLEQSAPTFFDGQDEDTTLSGAVTGDNQPKTFQDPPFCGFTLTADQVDLDVEDAFEVHGIEATPTPDGGLFVSMAQQAEPVIGLLLDQRGERHLVAATGVADCSAFVAPTAPVEPAPAPAPAPAPTPLPVTGGGAAMLGLLAMAGLEALRRR